METKCQTIGRNGSQMGTPCPPTENSRSGCGCSQSGLHYTPRYLGMHFRQILARRMCCSKGKKPSDQVEKTPIGDNGSWVHLTMAILHADNDCSVSQQDGSEYFGTLARKGLYTSTVDKAGESLRAEWKGERRNAKGTASGGEGGGFWLGSNPSSDTSCVTLRKWVNHSASVKALTGPNSHVKWVMTWKVLSCDWPSGTRACYYFSGKCTFYDDGGWLGFHFHVYIFFNEMGIICTNIAVKKRQEARACSEMEFLSMCWGVRWVLKKEG